jgi:hypothetical protein
MMCSWVVWCEQQHNHKWGTMLQLDIDLWFASNVIDCALSLIYLFAVSASIYFYP